MDSLFAMEDYVPAKLHMGILKYNHGFNATTRRLKIKVIKFDGKMRASPRWLRRHILLPALCNIKVSPKYQGQYRVA